MRRASFGDKVKLGTLDSAMVNEQIQFENTVKNIVLDRMYPYWENIEDTAYLEFIDCTEQCKEEYATGGENKVQLVNGQWVSVYDSRFSNTYEVFEGKIYKRAFGPLHHRKRTKKAKQMKMAYIPFRVQYSNYREYAEEYCCFVRKEGADAYGFYTNPNAEFDWFQIGGRWPERFLVKEGCQTAIYGNASYLLKDSPGSSAPEGYCWVAGAMKKDIAWDANITFTEQAFEEYLSWQGQDRKTLKRINALLKDICRSPFEGIGKPEPLKENLSGYGYQKDPDNPKRWIIDEEAAAVVRRIYRMSLDGCGVEQIADALSKDGILTPRFYWQQKGIHRPGKAPKYDPCHWNRSTITRILTLQEYCGDVLNFKTYSKSYKNKRRLENDRENWTIFLDVHEPIIQRSTWEKVQEKRGKIRKRRTHEGERNMFSGLLVCADCGNNLHFHFNQGNPEITYFNCSNYKGNRGTCTSTHYIRADFLEQVILAEIRRLTKFVSHYEKEFAKLMMGFSQKAAAEEVRTTLRELDAAIYRDKELDSLFERLYEDNVAGKITDERFARMSSKYEAEQKELRDKIKALQDAVERTKSKAVTADMFISAVRKYTRARKLTPRMLNELIEKIEVHQAEKVDGVWQQKLTIHYHCVGVVSIPQALPLPMPDITMNTRKGVYVSYVPAEKAG